MTIAGELAVLITANTDKFKKGIGDAQKSIKSFTSSMKGMLAAAGLAGGVGFGVKLAAEAEVAAKQFRVLTKSARSAEKMMASLRKFGRTEGVLFGDRDIQSAGRQLLGYGVAQDKVMMRMRQLGNAANATGARINDLAEIFGRVRQSGIAMNEDLERMNDRGISISKTIADNLGVGMMEFKKMAAAGEITFDMFVKGFEQLTTGSGQFAGASKEMADTVMGRWKLLQKQISDMALKIGETLLNNLDTDKLINGMTEFAKTLTNTVVPAMAKVADLINKAAEAASKMSKATGVKGVVPIPGVGAAVVMDKPQPLFPKMPDIRNFDPRMMGMQAGFAAQAATERQQQMERKEAARQRATSRVTANQRRAEGGAALSQAIGGIRSLFGGLEAGRQRLGGRFRGQQLRNQLIQQRAAGRIGRGIGGFLGGLSNRAGGLSLGTAPTAGGGFESNRAVMAGTVEASRLEERLRFQNERKQQEEKKINLLDGILRAMTAMVRTVGDQPNRGGIGGQDMKETL